MKFAFFIFFILSIASCKKQDPDKSGIEPEEDNVTLFVCGDKGTCSAINAKTSEIKWQVNLPEANILSSPTSENGLIFIASTGFNKMGKVIALDIKTGKQVWTFSTPGTILSTPLISDGKIYFGSWLPVTFSQFHSVDAKSGSLIWTSQLLSYYRDSSPTIHNDKIIFSTRDGLEILNKENGISLKSSTNNLSNRKLKKTQETHGLEPLVFSSPCISGDYAYLVTSNGFAEASEPAFEIHDLSANNVEWRFPLPVSLTVSSPTVYNNLVFFNDHNHIYAVDVKSHDTKWKFKFPNLENHRDYPYGSPTVQDGVVYIISLGSLFAIDALTGVEKWHYANQLSSSPLYYNSVIYVNSTTHTHAINAKNGQLLWKHALDSNEHEITSSPVIIKNEKEVFHSGISGNHQ